MFSIFNSPNELKLQISQYIDSKKSCSTYVEHKYWLLQFSKVTEVNHAIEIKKQHIHDFYAYVCSLESSRFRIQLAMKALACFIRFCHARRIIMEMPPDEDAIVRNCDIIEGNMATINHSGRPTDIKMVKRVKYLKNVHRLSFRKIKDKIEEEEGRKQHISSIHRWYYTKV